MGTEETLHIDSPIEPDVVERLAAGTRVLVSGVLYTARDAAHKRLIQALDRGEELPFDLEGQTIYYIGPSPARRGQVIGAAGPTTSARMDIYTPRLLAAGIRAMIGKGGRSEAVRQAIIEYRAVYLATIAGAGALLARAVKEAEVIAYQDLGPEAIQRLVVEDFPAIVASDVHGGDIYEMGRARYQTA